MEQGGLVNDANDKEVLTQDVGALDCLDASRWRLATPRDEEIHFQLGGPV